MGRRCTGVEKTAVLSFLFFCHADVTMSSLQKGSQRHSRDWEEQSVLMVCIWATRNWFLIEGLPFLESLYPQLTRLAWEGEGKIRLNVRSGFLSGYLLESGISALVAVLWVKSSLSAQWWLLPENLELAAVPFQQFIKSIINLRKGLVIYWKKKKKRCLFIYLLDSMIHKLK